MTSAKTKFWLPPIVNQLNGEERAAGFEIEFGNVAVSEAAIALQKALGGQLKQENPFLYRLKDSRVGTLRIERDFELLNSVRYRDYLQGLDIDYEPGTAMSEIEHGIDRLSRNLVPCEIVTSPIKLNDLNGLNDIIQVLHTLDARGSGHSIISAFGTHINPSAPDLSAVTITHYLQAFLLLYDWIVWDSKIDFTRRYITHYIDPFPKAYLELLLDSSYQPDEGQLIDDYLDYNPTRNRALDLLPLMCEIDEEKVLQGVNPNEKSLIKKRPAFHYRLPDCRVGDEGWSIATEWNRWWYVEVIANDEDLRKALMALWQKNSKELSLPGSDAWAKKTDGFLCERIEVAA